MSSSFFKNNLNYSMANEDTGLELSIVQSTKPQSILSVCGSGSRSLPLIHCNLKSLDLIDLSTDQLTWAKLRATTIEKLSYQDFIEFWGYKKIRSKKRKEKFEHLIKAYHFELLPYFQNQKWKAPITYGQWERTYFKLHLLAKAIVGKNTITNLKNTNNLRKQQKITGSFFFKLKWYFTLMIVGNRSLFNSLLYKGNFVKKNIPESYFQFYIKAFNRLFAKNLIQESFLLQLSFFGSIETIIGAPVEANEDVFLQTQNSISNISLNYINKNIITYLETVKTMYDFISISDVPSYFSHNEGKVYLQKIKGSLRVGGIIVIRYYLHECKHDLTGYEDITEQFKDQIAKEKTQMYIIKVLKKISS